MAQPKILVYDIETAPAIGLFFGKPYEVNIAKIVQHEYVLGFSYKWLGDKTEKTCYIWDFPFYQKKLKPAEPTLAGFLDALDVRIRASGTEVMKEWARLVTEAEVVLGHNSDQFDYKHMLGRVIEYGVDPVPWPLMIDTKKIAKQVGYYASNKLDDLGDRLGTGRKLPHTGYSNAIELWWDCMNDVEKAQKHMVRYNKVDVKRTEALYLKFRPYAKNQPNMAVLAGQPDACRHCGNAEGFVSNGYDYTRTGKYRRFQCKNCRGNNRSRTAEKVERPQYV